MLLNVWLTLLLPVLVLSHKGNHAMNETTVAVKPLEGASFAANTRNQSKAGSSSSHLRGGRSNVLTTTYQAASAEQFRNNSNTKQRDLGVSNDLKWRMIIQQRFGYDAPFFEGDHLGTHNSFNNKDDGYILPNHDRDVIDQLNAGFRLISWDIHWAWLKFRLCHSIKGGSLCGSTDTPLVDACKELRGWLDKNPYEFVVISIQDGMLTGVHRKYAAKEMYDNLGSDYLYRPARHGERNFPMWAKKYDLLAQGYRVMVFVAGDDRGKGMENWEREVFEMDIKTDYAGEDAEKAYNENRVPAGRFDAKTSYVIYEDRVFKKDDAGGTNSNNIGSEEEARKMSRYGFNQVGLDFAITNNRNEGFIWSYAPTKQTRAGNNYAVQLDEGMQWETTDPNRLCRAACRRVTDGRWAVSSRTSNYFQAPGSCTEVGHGYYFDVPTNGRYNYNLHKARNGYTGCIYVNIVFDRGYRKGFNIPVHVEPDLGCWKDDKNRGRALTDKNDIDNHYVKCIDLCRKKGHPYAGLQYGIECWCGDNYMKWGKSVNCVRANTKNRYQQGGGADANLVYDTRGYLGCWRDNSGSNRILNYLASSNVNSVNTCINLCRQGDYAYAGLQNGKECRCGNKYYNYKRGVSNNCNMRCAKNTEICGGDHANSVYDTRNYIGCWKDNGSTRVLPKRVSNSIASVDSCRTLCKNNNKLYAGLRNRKQCWCGDSYDTRGPADDCDMRCENNDGDVCGGRYSLSVYIAG